MKNIDQHLSYLKQQYSGHNQIVHWPAPTLHRPARDWLALILRPFGTSGALVLCEK